MSYNVPRWLRLYNYSKKLNISREKKTIEQNNKNLKTEAQECTFHPNTHYSSFYKEKPLNTEEINNSILERYNEWNKKKMNKIKRIYIQKRNNQEKICTYAPNIKRDNRYFINLKKITEDVVNDPESYVEYIQRKEKLRNEKKLIEKQRALTPGNGNIYNGKRTVIKEFNLETNKIKFNKCLSYSNIIKNNLSVNNDNKKFIIIQTRNNSGKKNSNSNTNNIFSSSTRNFIKNNQIPINNIYSRNKNLNNLNKFISKNNEEEKNVNNEFKKIQNKLHKELFSFEL